MVLVDNILEGNQVMNEENIKVFSSSCVYQNGRIILVPDRKLQRRMSKLVVLHPNRDENDCVLSFINQWREENNQLAKEHIFCYLESILRTVVYRIDKTIIKFANFYPELNHSIEDLIGIGRQKIYNLEFFLSNYDLEQPLKPYARARLYGQMRDTIFNGIFKIFVTTDWALLLNIDFETATEALKARYHNLFEDYIAILGIFKEYYIPPENSRRFFAPTPEQLQTMIELYSLGSSNRVTKDWFLRQLERIADTLREYLTPTTRSLDTPIYGDDSGTTLGDTLKADINSTIEDMYINCQSQELLDFLPSVLTTLNDRARALAILKYGLECTVREVNCILTIKHSPYIDTRHVIAPISKSVQSYLVENYNISNDINNIRQSIIDLLNRYYPEFVLYELFERITNPLPKHQVEEQFLINAVINQLQKLRVELSQETRSIFIKKLIIIIERWRNID